MKPLAWCCFAAALTPMLVRAEMFKCNDRDGKMIIRDSPCEEDRGERGKLIVPNAPPAEPRQRAEEETKRQRDAAASARENSRREAASAGRATAAATIAAQCANIPDYSYLNGVSAGRRAEIIGRDLVARGIPASCVDFSFLNGVSRGRAAQVRSWVESGYSDSQIAPKKFNGAINPRTGEYFPAVPGGVTNPKTGEFYPISGAGFINPKTGEYYPGQ